MPAGTVLNRLNVPPLYADTDQWVWKKWLDDVYTEFFKNGQPREVITQDNTTLGLEFFIPVDATTGALTVLLPRASDAKGKKYIIKKIDGSANVVTITPFSGDTVDGASTHTLSAQYDAVFIESDGGTNWFVLLGSGGGGSGAPVDAEYVVMALNPTLTQERVLTAGSGITIVDGGANSTVTISATAKQTQQIPIYIYTP